MTTTCWRCGSTRTWMPTYCNHGHCADCFAALERDHAGCRWSGEEHESLGPTSGLPGNVHCPVLQEDDE